MTVRRLLSLGTPWIVGSAAMQALAEKNLRDARISGIRFIAEPMARDTAGAIALICKLLELESRGHEIVGIFPSDHLITKPEVFTNALELAEDMAKKGLIVTLGIKPTFPATGYGYIQIENKPIEFGYQFSAHVVQKFHEKPNQTIAQEFLKEGSYYWNAGIFVFSASQMSKHLEKLQPQIWNAFKGLKSDLSNLAEVFAKIPSISIDFAVMEKLTKSELTCIPFEPGWNDVGSWDAVVELTEHQTANSNYKIEQNSKNNFVYPNGNKTYCFLGVDDLIVVDSPDALLVTKRGQTQDVKGLVDRLKAAKSKLVQEHTYEERPWGRFEVLLDTEDFKSKRITVSPGQQLSYQSHSQREEHWIVVKGSGEVVLNEKTIPVKYGTYINIPLGAKHRIRNNSKADLQFVEVQVGSYFGEDDIVRYQDDYNRDQLK